MPIFRSVQSGMDEKGYVNCTQVHIPATTIFLYWRCVALLNSTDINTL
jgi:hypothetical protein